MKKNILVVLAATLFLGIGIQDASADNSLKKGEMGINVEVDSTPFLSGKYMYANDLAILAGFGFTIHGGGDQSSTDIVIGAGAHKYLKVADFAPYWGGRIAYSTAQNGNSTTFTLQGEAGAEAFLQKHLSLEGTVAFGFSSNDVGKAKATTVGTSTAGISFNYYY